LLGLEGKAKGMLVFVRSASVPRRLSNAMEVAEVVGREVPELWPEVCEEGRPFRRVEEMAREAYGRLVFMAVHGGGCQLVCFMQDGGAYVEVQSHEVPAHYACVAKALCLQCFFLRIKDWLHRAEGVRRLPLEEIQELAVALRRWVRGRSS
jgi:hypothetical protein